MKPVVTVGICAKNAEKTIGAAIDSVAQQDYPHDLMEIILVDDGSSDGTLKIMKQYAAKLDIDVKVFTDAWRGIGAARNTVVNNARGKYIIWLDSDQTIQKNFVRRQISRMEQNPRIGIVTARMGIKKNENIVLKLELIPAAVEHSRQNWTKPSKLPGTCGSTYSVEAAKTVGGFNQKISNLGEDIEMANRIRQAGWLIIPGDAVFYETHSGMSTWGDLWHRYVFRGYHSRRFLGSKLVSLYRQNPLSSLLVSFNYAATGYRVTKYKIAFLLPFHFTFKMTAWFYGITRKSMG